MRPLLLVWSSWHWLKGPGGVRGGTACGPRRDRHRADDQSLETAHRWAKSRHRSWGPAVVGLATQGGGGRKAGRGRGGGGGGGGGRAGGVGRARGEGWRRGAGPGRGRDSGAGPGRGEKRPGPG